MLLFTQLLPTAVRNRYSIVAPATLTSTPPVLFYFCVADHEELDPLTCAATSFGRRPQHLSRCWGKQYEMQPQSNNWVWVTEVCRSEPPAVSRWGHTVTAMRPNRKQLLANKTRTNRWCHGKSFAPSGHFGQGVIDEGKCITVRWAVWRFVRCMLPPRLNLQLFATQNEMDERLALTTAPDVNVNDL